MCRDLDGGGWQEIGADRGRYPGPKGPALIQPYKGNVNHIHRVINPKSDFEFKQLPPSACPNISDPPKGPLSRITYLI